MPQREQNNLPPMQRLSDENPLMKYMEDNDATVQNLVASMKNLEVQIGQIASILNARPLETLPSDIEDTRQKEREQ
ncbi:hypothetical protein V6N13_074447 [Hibiscus sabdariffa]